MGWLFGSRGANESTTDTTTQGGVDLENPLERAGSVLGDLLSTRFRAKIQEHSSVGNEGNCARGSDIVGTAVSSTMRGPSYPSPSGTSLGVRRTCNERGIDDGLDRGLSWSALPIRLERWRRPIRGSRFRRGGVL